MLISLLGIVMAIVGLKFLLFGISDKELNEIAYSFQRSK